MKLTFKILAGLLLTLNCFTADAQKLKSFKSVNWLVGRWESEGKKGNIYEEWKLIDETKMEGRGYRVYKYDTIFTETMELLMEGADVYFVATVKDQNGGTPVRFKMTDGNNKHMDFENKEHDFPQIIKYQWKQNNHFIAEVSGLIKNKMKTQIFSYKKVN